MRKSIRPPSLLSSAPTTVPPTELGATMAMNDDVIDRLCVNTIRTLSIDGVQKANSGHPGLPLGAAPMAYVLWQRHLMASGADPQFRNRDRFVLSAGHGSMLLYSLLHLYGYPLTIDDLKAFRQWGSKTPGHPETFLTTGVEATTGPLGQGIGNAVGMAIAERMLAARFNREGHSIVDHWTFGLCGDGDLMEGISSEASSLAGHLKLGKLIVLYDSNDISLDGPTSLSFSTEDVAKRYLAYGWQVIVVKDGNTDLDAIDRAIKKAKKETTKPTLILVKTTIGYGSPKKAGTEEAHGSPLGPDEVAATKQALGWDPAAQFHVPAEAAERFAKAARKAKSVAKKWKKAFADYAKAFPDLASQFEAAYRQDLPGDIEGALPRFEPGAKLATRQSGGQALNALAVKLPWLVGGDADLSVSTNTKLKGEASFDGATGVGRNIHFGVREHAMAAIANGMAWHGGVRPFVATFFVFSDYCRPSLRLSALNHLPVIYVFTHDSVALGEDGPTHQPVEHLLALRAIPNVHVMRPSDANETARAWLHALRRKDGPTVLVLSRQAITTLDRTKVAAATGLDRGGYVLLEAKGGAPRVTLIGTGSEVEVALAAAVTLDAAGIATRVVSMPCTALFDSESAAYRESVLPKASLKVAIEAGVTLGWERYVGDSGAIIGIDRFGASAPGNKNLEMFGITAANVVAVVKKKLGVG
jgi:transketolase